MSNSIIPLSPASPGGQELDAEKLAGAGPSGEDIFRERFQIVGSALAEIARVMNTQPTGAEYALVVRTLTALGQQIAAASAPVVIASDQSAIPVNQNVSTTAVITKVPVNIASVTLFVANASAKGRKICNDSQISWLLVKEGAVAGVDDFSFKIPPNVTYEYLAPIYAGRVDGIWTVADAAGAARCTEES